VSGEGGKRDQILDGAGRAFGQYGFRKTTLADIVRESGVARATVYKYFPAKEEVFEAVVEREISDILRVVRAAVEGQDNTGDRLRAAVTAQIDALRETVNVFRLTIEAFSDVIGRTHHHMGDMAEEMTGLYREILEEGVRAGEIAVDDVGTTALSILLAFKGVMMSTVTGELHEQLPAVVDTLVATIWNGLRCREVHA
jgi:AcrR family transcriptional regulator